MKILINGILSFLLVFPVLSQWENCTAEEYASMILKIEENALSHPVIAYNARYELFEDAKDNAANQVYEGKYFKNTNVVFTSQFGSYFWDDGSFKITVDTVKHVVLIAKADSIKSLFRSLEDFKPLLKSAHKFEKKEEGELGIRYAILFKGDGSYRGMEILVKQNELKEMIVFMKERSLELEYNIEKIASPMMKVSFSNYIYPIRADSPPVLYSRYLFFEGNQVKLQKKYNHYQLIDLRNEK